MILLLPTLSGKKKRHRVKYGLDYFLDHILDHVLDHFMGGGGGTHHKFPGRGAMQSIVIPPYTSFGLLLLLNCFTIEQSTVKTSLYVN